MDIIGRINAYWSQFLFALKETGTSVKFLIEHKPWKGFWSYGWVSRVFTLFGFAIAFYYLFSLYSFLNIPIDSEEYNLKGVSGFSEYLGIFKGGGENFDIDLEFDGSIKYLILLFLEVVIFHVTLKSISILQGAKRTATFKDFLSAQWRMFGVVIRCYIFEFIWLIGLGLLLGLLDADFIKPIFAFLIQSFFLGAVILDNYFEQKDLEVKKSFEEIKNYAGLSIYVGLWVYFLLYIPFIGPFVSSIFGAILSTVVLSKYSEELRVENN